MRRQATLTGTLVIFAVAAVLLCASLVSAQDFPSAVELDAQPWVGYDARPVDIVICLDNSGSMKTLRDEVRLQLWDVVNELGGMTPTPALRVGLLTYGNRFASKENGWILTHSDLTHDLDLVYSRLMELEKEGGGQEYVGWVLHTAVEMMSWSDDPDALKIIFVAGNETADQGVEHHDFRDVASEAVSRGIIINTLYAGQRERGIDEMWLEVAERGDGRFSAVNRRLAKLSKVETPQDSRLEELNAELNASYVPFGLRGEEGRANQAAQDAQASKLGVIGSRIATKSTPLYNNSSWDLVDASQRPDFNWALLTDEQLPEDLQGLSEADLISTIEQKRAERESLRRQIRELTLQREQFLRSKLGEKPRAAGGLGSAIRETIRQQAADGGFSREQ